MQVPVASKKDGLHHGNAVADLPMDKGPKKDIVPMPKLETVPIVKEIVKEVVKNNDNGNETDCTPKIRIFENNDQPGYFSKDNNDVLTKPVC